MNREEILKQVKEYYEMELHNVELVELRKTWKNSVTFDTFDYEIFQSIIRDTLNRCQGVALFVQQLDIDYEDIRYLYEYYREKISALFDN